MGDIVSSLLGDTNENDVTSNNDLSLKQKKLMKQTWNKYIRPNLIHVGVCAMLKLFEIHPEIQNMFPDFENIPYGELGNDKKFHAHCQMIMTTLNNALDAFLSDNNELFTTILVMNGERHAKRAMGRINSQHFENVKNPLLHSLQQHMTSCWTEEVSDVWMRAVTIIIDIIISGINDYNN